MSPLSAEFGELSKRVDAGRISKICSRISASTTRTDDVLSRPKRLVASLGACSEEAIGGVGFTSCRRALGYD